MKATRHHFLLGFVLRASLVAATLPVILYGGEPRVIERGPHHKVWEQTATHRAADGKEFETRHSYVELASGLSYWDGAEWRDSREEISIVNGFAVAAAGQHKVIFAANLNSPGAIDMEAPDGKRFRSHIIGLSYTDSLSGDTVLIASIKDTVGAVASPNQVYYQDAFEGDLIADVRYTYRLGGFEQDVLILTPPPDPSLYGEGFDPATTRLEIWTEFIEIPEGQSHEVVLKEELDPQARQLMFEPDLIDMRLDYGSMVFETGQAFELEAHGEPQVLTGKSLEVVEGRVFLIEKVDYRDLEPFLSDLPQAAARRQRPVLRLEPNKTRLAAATPKPPSGERGEWKTDQFATSIPIKPAFVIDYTAVNGSLTNNTFKANTTYLVSGSLNLYQTTVFEGGTVLKFPTNSASSISLFGPVDCQTGPWHPAIVTASDDDSVGEIISGSTGSPGGSYAVTALWLRDAASTYDLHDLRIRFANTAILALATTKGTLRHSQIGLGNRAIHSAATTPFKTYNCLFYDLSHAFYTSVNTVTNNAENCTFHRVGSFLTSGSSAKPNLTNCLLIAVTNYTQHTGSGDVVITQNDAGIFQTVGGGSRYLAYESVYRNAGTEAVNPDLFADLAERTTFPPRILTNAITSDTTLFPIVERDDGAPALGYHYDPVDYSASGIAVSNVVLTLSPGVVFAAYGDSGFLVHGADGAFVSSGSAIRPNILTRYTAVQEMPIIWGENYTASDLCVNTYLYGASPPAIHLKFTKSYLSGFAGFHLYSDPTAGFEIARLSVNNCGFYGGRVSLADTTNAVQGFTNNVFARMSLEIIGGAELAFMNNLFWRIDSNWLYQEDTNRVWTLKDNLFDTCTNFINFSEFAVRDYNAYYNSPDFYSFYNTTGTESVLSSLSYETGTLGKFYQPSGSILINAGSRDADEAGLYHYTVTTNQVKEATSVVDVGFHYIATDGNGLPLDEDLDGVPDYVEDGNGNGIVDWDETHWEIASEFGLEILITRPLQGTQIP